MFQRILLPLDLTDRHQAAVEAAAGLANPGGELTLLHVIETIPGLAEGEVKSFYARIEKQAAQHLERFGQQLTARQIPWHSKVIVGSRVQDVVRFAAERQAGLIVLSAPRPEPDNPAAGWASLSWKIAMLAPCPVLLVK